MSLSIVTTQDDTVTKNGASFTSRRHSQPIKAQKSRFLTPHRSNSIAIHHDAFFTPAKSDKESVTDYVKASRKLLLFNLI